MFERSNVRRMPGNVPAVQPPPPAIKLSTNENPLEPSASVMAALAAIGPTMLQRYPDPLATELRASIARYHGRNVDQVIATNGSDELLRLVVTTFVDPGRAIGVLNPGYHFHNVLAGIQNCPLARVNLTDNWLPPDDAAERWNQAGARLVLLANPHAPSGVLLSHDWILRLADQLHGVLLVDEAYVDFIDPSIGHDLVREIGRIPNLLIARTLSKGHSLAGLRLGYGLGPAELVAPMFHKVRESHNVDAIAQHLGRAALENADRARESWDLVRAERGRLARALDGLGIATLPSQGNFLLAHIPAPTGGAKALHAALAAGDIHVRWFDVPRLSDWLRITIGTVAENDRLLAALAAMLRINERNRS